MVMRRDFLKRFAAAIATAPLLGLAAQASLGSTQTLKWRGDARAAGPGTFTLTLGGKTTPPMRWDCTAAEVAAAVKSLDLREQVVVEAVDCRGTRCLRLAHVGRGAAT